MRRIVVASGKGGTGKTTVAASLAVSLSRRYRVHLLDCDVEGPNAALLLRPRLEEAAAVRRPVPVVSDEACDRCGLCSEACRFHALAVTPQRVLVFPELCHGCGGCIRVCPQGALREAERKVGEIAEGWAGAIRFTQGSLTPGETATVQVIRAVRRRETDAEVVILDAPPGTSCPAMAAMRGMDWVVLVTEPTPFGLNDLRLAVEAARLAGGQIGVVINRDGGGDDRIERYCEEAGLAVIGRIEESRRVAEAYSRGELPGGSVPEFALGIEAIASRLTAGAAA
jgi:MinD superfamily P-loop ATPase